MTFSASDWIVHVDEAILVVNKPPGMPTLPDGYDSSAAHIKSVLEPDFGRLWIVHRLDRQTSGILLLARSAEAHRSLNQQFEKHEVRKTYHALILGSPDWDEKTIHLPLRPNGDRRHRTVVDPENGKTAITEARVIQRFGTSLCLVEAVPHTGRTHQIRAHLAAVGYPLAADALYGGGKVLWLSLIAPETVEKDIPILERAALHALSLEFTHPTHLERVKFHTKYAQDLAQVLHILRR